MDMDVSANIDAIPCDYEDLMEALKTATELVKNKTVRYDRLSSLYYYDLEKQEFDSSSARAEFDKQFFPDRAKAIR